MDNLHIKLINIYRVSFKKLSDPKILEANTVQILGDNKLKDCAAQSTTPVKAHTLLLLSEIVKWKREIL